MTDLGLRIYSATIHSPITVVPKFSRVVGREPNPTRKICQLKLVQDCFVTNYELKSVAWKGVFGLFDDPCFGLQH